MTTMTTTLSTSLKMPAAPLRKRCSPRRALCTVAKNLGSFKECVKEAPEGRPAQPMWFAGALAAGVAAFVVGGSPAQAVDEKLFDRGVERCSMEQLKKGAETRAAFSDFAGEPELLVNIEGCDYSGKDLSKDVMSGVRARGANFENAKFGPQSSRADFRGANMKGATFISTNLYESMFQGADLRGASFESALATGAKFGYDQETKQWANLEGTNFEDTQFSVSDVGRICSNPTLLEDDRAIIGCRD